MRSAITQVIFTFPDAVHVYNVVTMMIEPIVAHTCILNVLTCASENEYLEGFSKSCSASFTALALTFTIL